IRVSDIAKKMGKSEKDVIFQLQSLGAEINDASQELAPDVIQALLTGKKLTTRSRSVIMREDKPTIEKKKEAVRPPRPIVQPSAALVRFDRRPTAPPGPRARAPQGPRPNYAGQAPVNRPAQGGMSARGTGAPMTQRPAGPGGPRPSGPGGRPSGPGGARPS